MSVLPINGWSSSECLTRAARKYLFCVKYQGARIRKDYQAAYKSAFQLGVHNGIDEDPDWSDYVEARRTCCICLAIPEDATATALTPCVHLFCRACIDVWLQAHRTCPVCREHLCRYTVPQLSSTYLCPSRVVKNSARRNRSIEARGGRFFSEPIVPPPTPTTVLFRTHYCSKNKDKFCVSYTFNVNE